MQPPSPRNPLPDEGLAPVATARSAADSAHRTGRWVLLALAALLAAEWVHLFGLTLPQLVRDVPDDSFFYLQVALEHRRTGAFSFGAGVETYGFQPLWQLLMVALACVLPTTKGMLLGATAICAALHVAVAWQLFRLGSALGGAAAGAAAALLWALNPGIASWCWGLKENALYALLLVVAARLALQLLRDEAPRRGRAVSFGVALGLLVFTRFNAVAPAGLLLVATLAAPGAASPLRARFGAAALATVAALVVAAPWYLYAWLHFGTAMPTSGTWKLQLMKAHVELGWKTPWLSVAHAWRAAELWPRYLATLSDTGLAPFRALLVAAAAALAAAGLAAAARRRMQRPSARAWTAAAVLLALAGGAAANSYANQLFLPGFLGYAGWYAVPEFVVFAAAGGLLLGACARRPAAAALAVAAAIALAVTWLPPRFELPHSRDRHATTAPPTKEQLLEMGLWARRNVPDDAVVGMWDPGIFTFFSERRVVSFDPLMNSLDYQSGDLLDPVGYVQRQGVAYMFGVADRRPDGSWNYVPLPPGAHDIVWLPYPELAVGFSPAKRQHFAVVRPRATPAAAFLDDDDFPCGVLYPNDPARRRVVTRDRDRLVRGEAVAADVVRLWLALPDAAPPLELRAGDEVVARFDGGARGLHNVDVSSRRGAALSVHHAGSDPAAVVVQAHLVDYDW